jgi:hypothetical protein
LAVAASRSFHCSSHGSLAQARFSLCGCHAAKDAAIAAQEKLIAQLRTKKRSPCARIADILLGAGVIAVLK